MSKIRVYVAGSWKNKNIIKHIMEKIEEWGRTVVVDWTVHTEKGSTEQYTSEDLKGLNQCDCLVYCMDGTKSRGKNFELGYATALNKPIAIYVFSVDNTLNAIREIVADPNNINLSHDEILDAMISNECIFIRAKMYPILSSLDELRLWLANLSNMRKQTENNKNKAQIWTNGDI